MKNTLLKFAILPLLAIGIVSCEEVIQLELDKGESQLAVDALVSVDDGPQKIRLTLTRTYFDNAAADPAVGADVKIRRSDGKEFAFVEKPAGSGNYFSDTSLWGRPLEPFELNISYRGQTFKSVSLLPRKQVIDSLKVAYRESEFGNEAGNYLDLYAVDPVSGSPQYPLPDFFWLRYSLNGVNNIRPGNLLVGGDAAFNPGVADGLLFIYPVRNSINTNKAYLAGDSIDVELLSIDAENYRYLKEMQTQITNTGLFAQPSANVKGNIVNVDKNSKVPALGSFGMCQISRVGVKVK